MNFAGVGVNDRDVESRTSPRRPATSPVDRQKSAGDVDGLQGDVDGLQGDVDRLQGDVDRPQGDVDRLQGYVSPMSTDCKSVDFTAGPPMPLHHGPRLCVEGCGIDAGCFHSSFLFYSHPCFSPSLRHCFSLSPSSHSITCASRAAALILASLLPLLILQHSILIYILSRASPARRGLRRVGRERPLTPGPVSPHSERGGGGGVSESGGWESESGRRRVGGIERERARERARERHPAPAPASSGGTRTHVCENGH
jgi:hypothetical protein